MLPAQEALWHLARELDDTPLVCGGEIVFPRSCLYLWDFSEVKAGRLRFRENGLQGKRRNIGWAPVPRKANEDFSRYLEVRL